MSLNAKYQKLLMKSILLTGCSQSAIHLLLQSLSAISLERGFRSSALGPQKPTLGFVLEGTLDVLGANDILYFSLNSGDFFQIDRTMYHQRQPIPIYSRAKTNCTVTLIEKELLFELFPSDPVLCRNFIHILSSYVQKFAYQLAQFTAPTPSAALALYLIQYAPEEFHRLPDGIAGLARRLNISRATLYRALAELESLELIVHQDKVLHILDSDGLYQFIDEQLKPHTKLHTTAPCYTIELAEETDLDN